MWGQKELVSIRQFFRSLKAFRTSQEDIVAMEPDILLKYFYFRMARWRVLV